MNNIERTNKVYYELYSKALGTLRINEPKGWGDDTRSFKRDKESRAIIIKTEIKLEFFGKAAEFISTIFRGFGVSERILLSKYEKDVKSINEKWKLRYVQEIDLANEFKEDSRTGAVTVKAKEGGLFDDIDNRYDEEYNILDNESADGVDIGNLVTSKLQTDEKELFIESLLEAEEVDYRINSHSFRDQYVTTSRSIPLDEVFISDRSSIQDPSGLNEAKHNGIEDIDPQDQFILNSDSKKELRIKLDLYFTIKNIDRHRARGFVLRVYFRRAKKVNGDIIFDSAEELISIEDPEDKIGQTFTLDTFDRDITVEEGESLSFIFTMHAFLGDGIFGAGEVYTYLDAESKLSIEDKTKFPTSINRCIRPFDLFDRLIAKITGKKGLFRSSIFDIGGEYEGMVIDNGFWARGFPDVYTDKDGEEKRIQFNTSFKDAYNSFNYLEPLCWFVELEGNKQVLRLEKATHTMQNFVGIKLDAVDDISHESSGKDFFSSIELGHDGDLDYEEINGLDETNGKSKFSTHISNNDSKYSVVSKYRTDATPYELIRRVSFSEFPNKDTPRDDDIWIHDAKKTSFIERKYVHKLWFDYFDEKPTGIFSPDTAWNLMLSPMNRLLYGHGYSIKRGLYHYPNKSVRFNSSNANQNLKTVKDGLQLHEAGSVKVREMEKPRVEPEKTTFSFKMTQEIEDMFNGITNINLKNVPNYFGLIEYSEKGEKRYGRIVKLSGNEKSKLEIINAKL